MQYRYDGPIFPGAYRYGVAVGAAVAVQLSGSNCVQLNACSGGPVFQTGSSFADMCRVTGRLLTIAGQPARNVLVDFVLIGGARPVQAGGGRLIGGLCATVRSDVNGLLSVDLFRNDMLTPVGSLYQVSCKELGLSKRNVYLVAASADLSALLML